MNRTRRAIEKDIADMKWQVQQDLATHANDEFNLGALCVIELAQHYITNSKGMVFQCVQHVISEELGGCVTPGERGIGRLTTARKIRNLL